MSAVGMGSYGDKKKIKVRSGVKRFQKQKQKLFRANEPFISVFMWGVNHSIKELACVRMPLMLMPDDFKAYSKVKVDNHIFNKENLPSHFKVKEYCPMVFRRLREIFGISEKVYMNSLCFSQPIRTDNSGRSGARFLLSFDERFVIKTLSSEDIAEMHDLLPKYHQYVVEHSCKTLLPQYLGMYRLTLNNTEHYMIVMKNIFSPRNRVHMKYDLKGSTVQRDASDKEKRKELPTFKDNDFVKANVKLHLDPATRDEFLTKLKNDVEFLASLKLMDYSLLVGIFDCDCNDQQLQDDDEDDGMQMDMDGQQAHHHHHQQAGGYASTDDNGGSSSPPESPTEGGGSASNKLQDQQKYDEDFGEFYAVKSASNSVKREVYYMGLIDILTHYDTKKKAAHAMKTAKHGAGAEISSIQPGQYSKRFIEFLTDHITSEPSTASAATKNSNTNNNKRTSSSSSTS